MEGCYLVSVHGDTGLIERARQALQMTDTGVGDGCRSNAASPAIAGPWQALYAGWLAVAPVALDAPRHGSQEDRVRRVPS